MKMPPLQDITSSVLRENSLKENIQPQNELDENEFLRSLDQNNLLVPANSNLTTPVRRQASRSRSLPGSSVESISSNNRRSCHRFPSMSTPTTFYEDSMSQKFDTLSLSRSLSSSSMDDDVFECLCNSAKRKSKSKRRYSMPAATRQEVNINSEIAVVKFRNKKVVDVSTLLIEKLERMLKNVNRASPERIFGSRRDAVNFKRVESHVILLKNECFLQCRQMFENGQWNTLVKYVLGAVRIAGQLPTWDNTPHNLHKKQLIRVLGTYCQKCLILGNFGDKFLSELKSLILSISTVPTFQNKVTKELDKFFI